MSTDFPQELARKAIDTAFDESVRQLFGVLKGKILSARDVVDDKPRAKEAALAEFNAGLKLADSTRKLAITAIEAM